MSDKYLDAKPPFSRETNEQVCSTVYGDRRRAIPIADS